MYEQKKILRQTETIHSALILLPMKGKSVKKECCLDGPDVRGVGEDMEKVEEIDMENRLVFPRTGCEVMRLMPVLRFLHDHWSEAGAQKSAEEIYTSICKDCSPAQKESICPIRRILDQTLNRKIKTSQPQKRLY